MKTVYCFLVMLLTLSPTIAQPHTAIQPYVDFLSKKPVTAKEYILSLFKDHDIVFICERDHRDITQYDLYLDILSDPYFIDQVGVVFSEVGSRSLNPELNTFLHNDHLSEDAVEKQILAFRRNMLFFSVWYNYNWSYFIEGIYQINKKLPENKKLSWYPSDIYFETKQPTKEALKKAYEQFYDYFQRDSLMADYIIRNFREMKVKNPQQKALVIMNFRHAFNPNYYRKKKVKEQNTARFLFEAFPGQCANVMVNAYALKTIRSDNDIILAATQNGKWDAAFQYLNIDNAGFNFANTPFGKDNFDYDPRTYPGITYQNVFTGFVFYRFLPDFKLVTGIPHIAEDDFINEYEKREELYYEIMQSENPHEARQEILDLNKIEMKQEDFLEEMMKQIEHWLKHSFSSHTN